LFVFTGCKTSSQQSETTSASESSTNQDNSNLKFGNQTLILTGSTTLLEVAQKWAEEFMKVNGGKITVNGGGSGEGIASLLNGTTDLANASRSIKQDEIDKAKSLGLDIKEYTVLYDGICIVISKNINVKELTTDQLADIYMGKITNWKEVGGPDVNIIAVARDTNSGTGEYFLEEIIQKGKTQKENDYSPNCLRLQSNGDVVNQVANNDNTIGYIGIGYLKDAGNTVNTVAVKKGDKEAVIPTAQSVADKTYPISRALYIYANTKNMPAIAQAYIDFVLSNDGQKIGEATGFVKVQ
jgi:phosphate transport system substrate-binding protein